MIVVGAAFDFGFGPGTWPESFTNFDCTCIISFDVVVLVVIEALREVSLAWFVNKWLRIKSYL